MTDLLVIVPSRGRPAAVTELADTFAQTCTADTQLVIAIDAGNPQTDDYLAATYGRVKLWINHDEPTMVAALNTAASGMLAADPHIGAIAFMGDDHRPRTIGWDAAYLNTLRALGTGIVYGDDLLQHERIPTQVAMTANIVRGLGHMAPPTLTHLFVDNYWRDLGEGAGCLRYLPDVVVEHVHPFAGKAPMDEGYARVNDHGMYHADSIAYAKYAAERLALDIAKVKGLR